MEREDLDELAQDLLGRPLTAAEYRDPVSYTHLDVYKRQG